MKVFKYQIKSVAVSGWHNVYSFNQHSITLKDKVDLNALKQWKVAQLYDKNTTI